MSIGERLILGLHSLGRMAYSMVNELVVSTLLSIRYDMSYHHSSLHIPAVFHRGKRAYLIYLVGLEGISDQRA